MTSMEARGGRVAVAWVAGFAIVSVMFAAAYLYPLIESWPTPSPSAELAEAAFRARAVVAVVALFILLGATVLAYAYQWRQAWLSLVRQELENRAKATRRASELAEAERIAGVGSFVWTPATGALRWSDGLSLLLRRDPALPPPTYDTLARYYTPQSWETLQVAAARVLETGLADELESEMIRADGTTCWTVSRYGVVRGPDGAVATVHGTVYDIDALKRAELELHERELRYLRQRNALIDLGKSEALNGDDLALAFRRITEVTARTLGVARASVWRYNVDRTAIRCEELYELEADRHSSGGELAESAYPAYFKALADAPVIAANDARTDLRTSELLMSYLTPLGITSMLDAPIVLRGAVDGVLCHEHVGVPRQWTTDEAVFAVAVANAASLVLEGWERRRAEASLHLQSAALNAAASAIAITSRSGVIEWINPAFTALTGYSDREAIGANVGDLLKSGVQDESFYANLWNTILAGEIWRGEITNRRKDGSLYLEGMSITPVREDGNDITHFIAIKRDLTAQKQLEAQFLQSQKMEVVGRLAGGIAHDFNNLLTVINGTAELLADDLAEGGPLREDAQEILRAGARAAALTSQLLAFSRRQVVAPEVISMTAVLADLRSMLQRMIGEDITLTIVPGPSGCWIKADRGQIEQALMNLVVNARDAMPQGGVITITARDVERGSALPAACELTGAGPYVLVEVADTGVGMDAATRARVFEPFFTTKEHGKGTGLGLATVYGIVKQSGGSIVVDSAPGRGATFRICLPQMAGITPADQARAPAAALTGETILVVEDEDGVRQMTRRMLESTGYRVLTAANGAEALTRLERHAQPVHLMLTDVVMPGMSGPDLVRLATGIRPATRILYMSGHTDNDALRHSILHSATHFIAKPFTREELVRAVRETLDSPAPASSGMPAAAVAPAPAAPEARRAAPIAVEGGVTSRGSP